MATLIVKQKVTYNPNELPSQFMDRITSPESKGGEQITYDEYLKAKALLKYYLENGNGISRELGSLKKLKDLKLSVIERAKQIVMPEHLSVGALGSNFAIGNSNMPAPLVTPIHPAYLVIISAVLFVGLVVADQVNEHFKCREGNFERHVAEFRKEAGKNMEKLKLLFWNGKINDSEYYERKKVIADELSLKTKELKEICQRSQ